ncbi:MAG: hypothetical protein QNJ45_05750 [Ardenticatenaceae bacterium]|nr:hypothetical protein [Ardenticatenaceae bacterium]
MIIETIGVVAFGAVWGWLMGLALARPVQLLRGRLASFQGLSLLLLSCGVALYGGWLTALWLTPLFLGAAALFFILHVSLLWRIASEQLQE